MVPHYGKEKGDKTTMVLWYNLVIISNANDSLFVK